MPPVRSTLPVSRRLLLRQIGLAAVAAGALSACGGTQAGPTAPGTASHTSVASPTRATVATSAPPAGKGGTTLQVFIFAKDRGTWLQEVAQLKSQESSVPLTLDLQQVGNSGQLATKLQTIIAGGAPPPDLAEVEISQFPHFIAPGQTPPFAPLDGPLQGRQKDLFAASATDPWSWEGNIFGLGNELNACVLSVRRDLFKQAGIDSSQNIATWLDFLDIGAKVKAIAKQGITFWNGGTFALLGMQAGGGLFDQNRKPVLNSPANLKVLQFMQDAVAKQQIVALLTGADGDKAIATGGVAALTGPAWMFSGGVRQKEPQTKGEWHVLPLPRWSIDGSHGSWSQGGTGLVAPVAGKQRRAAEDFIVYAHTTTKAVLIDYKNRNTYPTWRPAYQDPSLKRPVAFFGGQAVADVLVGAAADMAAFITSPIYPQVSSLASKAATLVLQGKQNPTDALQTAQQQAEGIYAAQQHA